MQTVIIYTSGGIPRMPWYILHRLPVT